MNQYEKLLSDLNDLGVTKTVIAHMIGYDRSYLYRNIGDDATAVDRKVGRLLEELSAWREYNKRIIKISPTSPAYPTYLEDYFMDGEPTRSDLEWGKLMFLLDRHLTMFGVKRVCEQAGISPLFVYRYVPSRAGEGLCFPKPVWSNAHRRKVELIRFAIEHFYRSLDSVFTAYCPERFDSCGRQLNIGGDYGYN